MGSITDGYRGDFRVMPPSRPQSGMFALRQNGRLGSILQQFIIFTDMSVASRHNCAQKRDFFAIVGFKTSNFCSESQNFVKIEWVRIEDRYKTSFYALTTHNFLLHKNFNSGHIFDVLFGGTL